MSDKKDKKEKKEEKKPKEEKKEKKEKKDAAYKLSYFAIPKGRAERVRLTLSALGLTWEEESLTFPDFGAQKMSGRFPFGSMPVLTIDGSQTLGNSGAILAYLSKEHKDGGLEVKDPVGHAQVIGIVNATEDRFSRGIDIIFSKDEAAKGSLIEAEKTAAANYVTLLKLFLGSRQFLVGDHLTVADITVYDWASQMNGINGAETLILADPALKAWYEGVAAYPGIKEYLAKRDAPK